MVVVVVEEGGATMQMSLAFSAQKKRNSETHDDLQKKSQFKKHRSAVRRGEDRAVT